MCDCGTPVVLSAASAGSATDNQSRERHMNCLLCTGSVRAEPLCFVDEVGTCMPSCLPFIAIMSRRVLRQSTEVLDVNVCSILACKCAIVCSS